MRKTWIKFKRELLEPEQRERLGIRIWLYMHILDRADWDTGKVFDWRDKLEAEDFGMQWRTLQQQRQQLENDGFISCFQSGDHQVITIHNWTNPREYGGDIYNPYGGGTENRVPLNVEGTIEGTYEGTREGSRKHSTPTYDSQITDHMSHGGAPASVDPVQILAMSSGLSAFPADQLQWTEVIRRMAEDHGVDKTIEVMKIACANWVNTKGKNSRYYRVTNLNWINWAQDLLLTNGRGPKDPSKMTDKEYLEWSQQGAQHE